MPLANSPKDKHMSARIAAVQILMLGGYPMVMTWETLEIYKKLRQKVEVSEEIGHKFYQNERYHALEGKMSVLRCIRCWKNVSIDPSPSPNTCVPKIKE